ncbi:connector enhancer of kinase suppressor of ras 1 isoform X1 [Salmo salar]|uniref:Connector enhancer of kinase suppressor of ras 1 isoform X1 n=1 Tax=Salmo salar TaxID=8030 RepID=A0A1S3SMK2_SALSA|nr:connector enhancer of kinase suppressor of ras 1 isoform X1 [Salmo salar]|eukprot:XP_014065573.1 PREDICTED: connector enhancer of kinase suppressor of ras 2-like isoform X1 [Salmo salar]
MEPITSWSKERVSDWLKGLDVPLQQYPFTEWQVTGLELLQLSSQDLERLGVHKIGHQELILEAVEKLCSLTYGMGGESLRCLTEKLRIVVHSLTMGIQVRWRVNPYDGQTATRLPASVLQVVLELITSAKGLFSLLNRYQFAQLSAYTTSRNIITHCKELGTTVHKDSTVYEKEKDIISICRQLEAVCDEILNCSPEALLTHTAQLESVDLVPVSPGDHLGIEITSTGSSNHYITGTTAESPAEFCEKILAGDEVIQVNDQIVVGWSRKNLVKKLRENPSGVTLVLKKVPVSLRSKETAQQPPSPQKEEEEEEEEDEGNQKHSVFERVAASVRSLSFRAAVQGQVDIQPVGQEKSELSSDRGLDGSLTYTLCPRGSQGDLSYLSSGEAEGLEGSRLSPGPNGKGSAPSRSPSPRVIELGRASISSVSSCPEMGGHTEDKEQEKGSTKGTRKVMSRRRVSCRELSRPECDGWLWKKRKESSVFMTQKWQRFWFVLKGPSLYWYTSQQEEKAEGLVKISSYNIEGAGEHKRKYVFQMCHQRFQTFFFAAENVNDMTKWINCLISAIQKHKKFHKGPPDSEEECYSETESEDEGSSPSPHRNKIYTKTLSNTLPRARKDKDKGKDKGKDRGKDKDKKDKMHVPGPPTGRSRSPGAPEDEMGVLFHRLNEGGVSLIGSDKLTTHDHFRKSFIRRNKNPVINEKAHALRVLQSTLKDKEAELQVINKVLEDSDLTSQKYRQWKEHNEDLHLVIEKLAVQRAKAVAKARAGHKEDQDTPPEASPGKQVAVETGGVCGLSLSDGEMLVDAEPLLSSPVKNAGDLDVEPQSEHSSTAESSTDKQSSNTADVASQASPDNYFYI